MKKHHDPQKMKEDSPDNQEESSDNIQRDNPVNKFLAKQSKQTRLIILISVMGLLAFTLIATVTPFKDTLFNLLYPKPSSRASDLNINSEIIQKKLALASQYDLNGDGFLDFDEIISQKDLSGRSFSKGYIVRLQDQPVADYQKGLRGSNKSSIKEYKQSLLAKQKSVKESIRTKLGKTRIMGFAEVTDSQKPSDALVVKEEYTTVFNGFALNITAQEAESIKQIPEIKAVYPDYKVKAFLNESVPLIKATDIWNLKDSQNREVTGQGVTIGIIDTGVDYTHPDLGACSQSQFSSGSCPKVTGGYDFANRDNDPIDDSGHGTHVAATAAGDGSLKGVAPEARIVAYKVLDADGRGYVSSIIAAIERSADPNQDGDTQDHLDVINISLGGPGSPNSPDAQAIDRVVDLGVVAVIAAGNSGPDEVTIGSPGVARKAITVAANDKNKKIASFSSRGPVPFRPGSDYEVIKPNISAPGVNICAAQWDNWLSSKECIDDKHISISGTSMATPHIAGAVALIKQLHPSWTPDKIKSILMTTADDLGENAITQGTGMGNLLKAAQASTYINPGSLDFGFVNKSSQQWRVTKRIVVTNIKGEISATPSATPTLSPTPTPSPSPTPTSQPSLSPAPSLSPTSTPSITITPSVSGNIGTSSSVLAETSQTTQYSLSLKQNIAGSNISFSESQFPLAPGESKEVEVILTVDNTATLAEGSYFNEILTTEGNNTYRVPVFFFKKEFQIETAPNITNSNLLAKVKTPYIDLLNSPKLTIKSPSGSETNIQLSKPFSLFGSDPTLWRSRITFNEEGIYSLTATSTDMPGYSISKDVTIDKTAPNLTITPSESSDRRFLNVSVSSNEELGKSSYAGKFIDMVPPPSGLFDSWYPSIHAEGSNVYVAYLNSSDNSDNSEWKIYFVKSSDFGKTWSQPVIILTAPAPYGSNLQSLSSLTKLNGKLYFAYKETGTNNLKVISSSDEGSTWSQSTTFASDFNVTHSYANLSLKAAGDKLHLIYLSDKNAPGSLKYVSSNDGISWSTPIVLKTLSSDQSFTGIDLRAEQGKIRAAVTIRNRNTGKGDVLYFSSSDGVSWNTKEIVQGGLTTDYPSIDSLGDNIFIVWSNNIYGYINMAKSTDGGNTWSTKNDITSSGLNLDWTPRIGYANNKLTLVWYRNIFIGDVVVKTSNNLGESWGPDTELYNYNSGLVWLPSIYTSSNTTHISWSVAPGFDSFRLAYTNDLEAAASFTFNNQEKFFDLTKSGSNYSGRFELSGEGGYNIKVTGSDKAGNFNTKTTIFNYYQNYYFGEFLETYNSRRGDSKYNEKYDVNSDGRVSILDWSVLLYKFTPQSLQLRAGYSASELLSTYNKSSTDSGFIPRYDVNTDNIVNKADYVILNTAATPTPTPTPTPTATPKAPDLVVNKITVLGTPRVKSRNSINVTIQNKGNLFVRTRGILSLKITQPDKTDLGSCNGSFSSPAINKTTTVQIRKCPAFKTPGSHTITATADSTNTIPESNENNNTLSTTINVR